MGWKVLLFGVGVQCMYFLELNINSSNIIYISLFNMSHSNVEYSKIDNFMRNLSNNAHHHDLRVS